MTGATGHQAPVLNALGDGTCLTIDQLAAALPDLDRRQIVNALSRLINRALVERVERGCYRVTGAGRMAIERGDRLTSGPRGPMPRVQPRRDSLTTRLWRAMRLQAKFTTPDLVALAARDESHAHHAAARYLRHLAVAGYVLRHRTRTPGHAPTSNGFIRWSLVRDTGDLAPIVRRDGLYDPNTQELIPWTIG